MILAKIAVKFDKNGANTAFREYDADLGRWWSLDSKPTASESWYAGMGNNPVNKVDPDGQWSIEVHSYKDRGKGAYAVFIAKDRNGNEVYRTVVKTTGNERQRNTKNNDTPQGTYKILGYYKTGGKTNYPSLFYGPNDLLALEYLGGEGGKRQGMHVHGGRQEGEYKGRKELMSTHGCMRINDNDILELKNITSSLEKNDPLEKKETLKLTDDLKSPVKYDPNRHDAGTEQFPKPSTNPEKTQNEQDSPKLLTWPTTLPTKSITPQDNTTVVIPYRR